MLKWEGAPIFIDYSFVQFGCLQHDAPLLDQVYIFKNSVSSHKPLEYPKVSTFWPNPPTKLPLPQKESQKPLSCDILSFSPQGNVVTIHTAWWLIGPVVNTEK